MDQKLFWIISSINFVCILIITVVNIIMSRKTAIKLNQLTRNNTIDLGSFDKLLTQFATFLSSIDENKITIPITKLGTILSDNTIRNEIMDSILSAKAEVEVSYYKLLILLSTGKTNESIIADNINEITLLYKKMNEALFLGLTNKCKYYDLAENLKDGSLAMALISSWSENLANYSRIRETFTIQKDRLMKEIKKYIENEMEIIKS